MMLTTHFFHFHVLSTWFVLTCQPMCVWNIVLLFHKENIIMYLYFTKKNYSLNFLWNWNLTKSSSTLWLIPGDVSMYLTPYFIARDFPSKKENKIFFLIFLQNLWNVSYSFVLEFLLYVILNSIYKNFWISSSVIDFRPR